MTRWRACSSSSATRRTSSLRTPSAGPKASTRLSVDRMTRSILSLPILAILGAVGLTLSVRRFLLWTGLNSKRNIQMALSGCSVIILVRLLLFASCYAILISVCSVRLVWLWPHWNRTHRAHLRRDQLRLNGCLFERTLIQPL